MSSRVTRNRSCGTIGLFVDLACSKCKASIGAAALKSCRPKFIKSCWKPFDEKHQKSYCRGKKNIDTSPMFLEFILHLPPIYLDDCKDGCTLPHLLCSLTTLSPKTKVQIPEVSLYFPSPIPTAIKKMLIIIFCGGWGQRRRRKRRQNTTRTIISDLYQLQP